MTFGHRTVLPYWKSESISLQRGVKCELSPEDAAFPKAAVSLQS
jgi:hypothetical protein